MPVAVQAVECGPFSSVRVFHYSCNYTGSALTPTLGYLSLMMTILSSVKSCSLGSSIATFKPAFQKGVRLGLIQSLSHVRSLCFAITDDTAGGRENCTVPALSRHYTANTRIIN